jgi:orotidine-5'-phosphate decarboxylase
VHASGEPAMLAAAARGVRGDTRRARRPLLLGVTVLTSVADDASARVRAAVLRLAERALRSGCDGVVASAQEAAALRSRFGRRLYLVCPGIRPAPPSGGAGRAARLRRDDQSRVASPAQAVAAGADAIVVGRPITGASDPRAAARMILRAMEDQHAC